jgi:hypothetical protein
MSSTSSKNVKLNFTAGIHRESTQYAEEGSWFDVDRVRFREGRPENIRGYIKKDTTPFAGTGRDLKTWSDNDTIERAVFGTEDKLYQFSGGTTYDITPIRGQTSVGDNVLAIVTIDGTNNGFYTVAGSTRVSVSVSAHGAETGDYVSFTSATTIGGSPGIILNNNTFQVSVLSNNQLSFDASTTADANNSHVGTGTANFLLHTGTNVAIQGLGFGAGIYNAGVSITGVRAWDEPASESDIIFRITQWSLDNFGEDIVACRRGGRIYFWDTSNTAVPRAALISASPTITNSIVVSPNDRHVIALGTTEFGTGDYQPMLVRWSDQNDYNNFTPSVSSTSGENLLADGTEIVGSARSRNAINIWTDNSLWLMQFVGPPFTFKFQQMGTNCGLIGPHAGVDYDGRSVWMGKDNFYMFDGQVRNLDCTVRKFIFDRLNTNQVDKVYAGINSEFKEVMWLYPSNEGSNEECDSYVIWSPDEDYWTYGSAKWTAWDDKVAFNNVITTGVSGSDSFLFDNEPPNVFTGDGAALTSFIESADFDIEDGDVIMFMDRLIPDFDINDGNITIELTGQNFPVNGAVTRGPFDISKTTQKIDFRLRGRQARIKVSCDSQGTSWRYGSVRLAIQPDGRR